jgi:hypothetical protein
VYPVFALGDNLDDFRKPDLRKVVRLQGAAWLKSSNLYGEYQRVEKGLVTVIKRTVDKNTRLVSSAHSTVTYVFFAEI